MVELHALLEMRQAVPLSFSPDGARLLVGSNLPGTQQLYALPARGGELEQLTDLAEPVVGHFLPDGRDPRRDGRGRERADAALRAAATTARSSRSSSTRASSTARRTPAAGRLAYATNRAQRRRLRHRRPRPRDRARSARSSSAAYCSVEAVSPDGRCDRRRASSASGAATTTSTSATSRRARSRTLTPHEAPPSTTRPSWLGGRRSSLATNAGRDTFAHRTPRRRWSSARVASGISTAPPTMPAAACSSVANEDGYSRLTLLDPQTFELREEVPLPGAGVVEHPVFSPDGSLLAFCVLDARSSRTTSTSTTSTRASSRA